MRRKVEDVTTYGKFLAKAPVGIDVVIDPREKKNWGNYLQGQTGKLLTERDYLLIIF